jgi:hypothetical protein
MQRQGPSKVHSRLWVLLGARHMHMRRSHAAILLRGSRESGLGSNNRSPERDRSADVKHFPFQVRLISSDDECNIYIL